VRRWSGPLPRASPQKLGASWSTTPDGRPRLARQVRRAADQELRFRYLQLPVPPVPVTPGYLRWPIPPVPVTPGYLRWPIPPVPVPPVAVSASARHVAARPENVLLNST